MANIPLKIILKSLRTLGVNSLFKIRKGVLKGQKWSVSIPDSRYIAGEYEEALSELVVDQVSKSKRFIDIGANAGYFSLVAAKYGQKDVEHLAIEPFPENVDLLNKHLSVNNIKDVNVKEMAISDQNGEIEFSDSGNLAANTYKTESSVFSNKVIKVKTMTLDQLAEENQLNESCFLKIDVEGAEYDVLKGGKIYLSQFKPDLVLATHDNHVKGVKVDCLNFLSEIGYKCSTLADVKIDGQEDFFCKYE
ncbi:MAG: FkbM family methyltransferase [Crocinitomicaceae bacterium]|nr:FkbM family methyltransferase [Crocinitomicaceae bacterium]